MSVRELHDKLKLGRYKYIGHRYYDYPDGQDLLGKLAFTTKASGFVGLVGGLVYSASPPAPNTYGGQLFRILKVTVPMVGVAATFTVVTYFSTVIRKKDDQINYIFGSIAAGSLMSPIVGKGMGVFCSAIFTAFGVLKKTTELQGKKMIMPVKRRGMPSYYTRKLNTSIVDERKGTWTKELPAN